jgi:hypothetical protein
MGASASSLGSAAPAAPPPPPTSLEASLAQVEEENLHRVRASPIVSFQPGTVLCFCCFPLKPRRRRGSAEADEVETEVEVKVAEVEEAAQAKEVAVVATR